MTSSDATALSARAIDAVARRVGHAPTSATVGGEARVALVCAKFNGGITERLLEGALAGLEASGVKAGHGDRGLGARRLRAAPGGPAPGRSREPSTPSWRSAR